MIILVITNFNLRNILIIKDNNETDTYNILLNNSLFNRSFTDLFNKEADEKDIKNVVRDVRRHVRLIGHAKRNLERIVDEHQQDACVDE